MPSPGLTAPLRRPLFRRLAATYAINELGDWMGLIALSVLVYDETGSALATAALFIGTGFLPALLAPALVARVELPPPRFALPLLYCAEAAAFAGLALLALNFSLVGIVIVAAIDGALMLAGALADPGGRRGAARAGRRAAGRQRDPQHRLHRRGRGRPRARWPGRRRLRRTDRAAARRDLLLRDRLDPLHRRQDAAGRARARPYARAGAGRRRLHPRRSRPCAACCTPRGRPSSSSPR